MTDFLSRLKQYLPAAAICTDPDRMAPRLLDQRGRLHGAARALVLPGSVEEAERVIRLCNEYRVPIVPQAGNTGLVGGATPAADGRAILLGCDRLNRVRQMGAADFSMVAEAGCTLESLQRAAAAEGRLFPLWLASAGSARLGGLIGSNAGGTQVLRYGNTRELVLGIEAVLADGRRYNGLHSLRKRNIGYDLKQLLIGSEGTLGFVTAASLRLWPQPKGQACALVAVASIAAALTLFQQAQDMAGEVLTAFEIINAAAMQLVADQHAELARPFATTPAWTVLIELSGGESDAVLSERLCALLSAANTPDALVAQDLTQRQHFWGLRERIPSAQKRAGSSIKHDLSLPIAAIPEFVQQAAALLAAHMPLFEPVIFGHVGDGNLHFNLQYLGETGAARKLPVPAFDAAEQVANELLYPLVLACGGDLSAEHGIGRLRLSAAARYHDAGERALMATLKQAFDPLGLFNPGALLSGQGNL
ncbi:FAD-binding oxidoreductase [Parachitinimonas caeni]|uniref:FAD-binding oxidoreductase n=1 Tax=Parachitinimonas caeni TaxID=3031301 RepID=A0ABT7E470_9NEIS|nr:FAD-binding oxidoreductase [Parachitinimonas caeni]MDK2125682.1 FAD-binding oxidoreductase [Parachitinimonas caeni]